MSAGLQELTGLGKVILGLSGHRGHSHGPKLGVETLLIVSSSFCPSHLGPPELWLTLPNSILPLLCLPGLASISFVVAVIAIFCFVVF